VIDRVPRVVAIDGAAGSGKSTLARRLAERIGLPYINTGLMYRALTAAALASGTSPEDEAALSSLAGELTFTVSAIDHGALEVEGSTVEQLSTLEVEANVSAVARHPRVRDAMRRLQRDLGLRYGAVMEGRDIGSVVFPDAPVKLFLEADEQTRAERRAEERASTSSPFERSRIETSLHVRDARDSATNPLQPVVGAVVIRTDGLDPDETLAAALAAITTSAPELLA
jgi:cytidylate kinase